MRKSDLGDADEQYLLDLATSTTDLVATKAASGAQAVIAAPAAGKRLCLTYCKLQRTAATTTEVVCILKAGTTAFDHAVLNNDVPGVILFDARTPLQWRVLPAATALNLDLSAAYSVEVVIRYLVLDAEQS